jgi:hypothetical protein
MDNTLPYLFSTNAETTTHNNNVFHTTPSQTYKFLVHDITHVLLFQIINYSKLNKQFSS